MAGESNFEVARALARTIIASQGDDVDLDVAVAGAVAALAATGAEGSVEPAALRRALEELVTVRIGAATGLEDNRDHEEWLDEESSTINWRFWERYRVFLESQDLAPTAVRHLNTITDDILGRLESPRRDGAWDRRGMVVGQVQSGKTSNYTGVICKAADAGYRVIVVLAGLHDSLRAQTQHRVDEGFLGFDSRVGLAFDEGEADRGLGAGALPGAESIPVYSLTSALPRGDFKRTVAQTISGRVGRDPVVLVVKKHKTILENLLAWIATSADPVLGSERRMVMATPLLVIDDEADNASVNTRDVGRELDELGDVIDETDPTTINRLIRRLLHGFERSAYIGYTATPFANIFIAGSGEHSVYGDDLFPRSFIRRMPPPSNYVGPARVFGVRPAGSTSDRSPRPLPIIRAIDDHEDFVPSSHGKELEVGDVPDSLREAIGAFVLTCATRRARGQVGRHNSMLIHVTRYVDVQAQVTDRVAEVLDSMARRIRNGEGASTDTLVNRLRRLWETDFVPTSAAFTEAERGAGEVNWEGVEDELLAAITRIRIATINGTSADAVTYSEHPDGLSVIAIGGDKLSRGLTLEGLSVSYYLRASRMYDTLMQMGRWFGYRPGYLDLCRLYTTSELSDWYRDITVANEELMEEFDAMAASRGTPEDWGLRVRSHPAGLLITARAKMRNGVEMDLDLSGSPGYTNAFSLISGDHRHNLELVEEFIAQQSEAGLRDGESERGDPLWRGVPGREVGALLSSFRTADRARRANGRAMATYIDHALRRDELTDWTVALINNGGAGARVEDVAGLPIGLTRREPHRTGKRLTVSTDYTIGQILSPIDEAIDLDEGERERARQLTRENLDAERSRRGAGSSDMDGVSIRRSRPAERGLLLLYPLDPEPPIEAGLALERDTPVVGFYVSFPRSRHPMPVRYVVNNVFWQQDELV